MILLFILLFSCVTNADEFSNVHVSTRQKRSNFPCGKSFVPCAENAAFGIETNTVDFIDGSNVGLENINSLPQKSSVGSGHLRQLFHENVINKAANNSKIAVDAIFNDIEAAMISTAKKDVINTPYYDWSQLFKITQSAKELSYPALVSIKTSQAIKNENLRERNIMVKLSQAPLENTIINSICPAKATLDCTPSKFRTYSGSCNNVNNPFWGATNAALQRLQTPDYADGISAPRRGTEKDELPDARSLSQQLFSQERPDHSMCSLMVAQWAQFVYEDLAQIAGNNIIVGNTQVPIPCCTHDHPECFNIVPKNDGETCIPYSRSLTVPHKNCSLGVREQGNVVSSYLDGSQVYGSDDAHAFELRLFKDGLLKSQKQRNNVELLPALTTSDKCLSRNGKSHACFNSGSQWTNLLPTNAAFHTIWLRQHNRVAKLLKGFNFHWDDERIYQETRRIVIAQIQHITYAEFLPIIVGKEQLRKYSLRLQQYSFDSNYDIETNAGTLNEYAAAAGLFFFSLYPDMTKLTSVMERISTNLRHGTVFNDVSTLYTENGADALVKSMLTHPIKKLGPQFESEFKENFLKRNNEDSIDLVAMLIQMGRDHGLNSYVSWRQRCGLTVPNNFTDLPNIFEENVNLDTISNMYNSVNDIDLIVGGLSEKTIKGSLLGPTFGCIIGRQFKRTRRGDRYWYENFFQPSAFSEKQLAEIKKTTLSEIICSNTVSLGQIQVNVFQIPDDYGNFPIVCNASFIEKPDFSLWTDQEPKLHLPITKATLEKALKLGIEQYKQLNNAEQTRIDQKHYTKDSNSALFAHASLMAPKQESLELARTAAILRETTNVLLHGKGLDQSERLPPELDIATLQKLLPEIELSKVIGNFSIFLGPNANNQECLPKPLPCDHTSKFRTMSGWCNNLKFPHYANAFAPLRRLLNPAYDDGFDLPRVKSRTGRLLPSARKVSNAVHEDQPLFHVKYSHMLMQFGQIIDHDMTHSPIARGPNNDILNCSSCDSPKTLSIHCFPIKIDANDPFYPHLHSDGTPRCMPFARSLLGQVTLGYRNQLNQLTSFLDASYIYGSTECEANTLRLFNQGKLNFTNLGFNKVALPQGPQERDCRTRPRHPCFIAGDDRNNEQPGITALHTIFLREHNRIASNLHTINNFWSDERLFQESRRILIAKMQHIIFSEWLPVVLGTEVMARYSLSPLKTGYYEGYDENCDASISQELSTAAFRFGHTLIRNYFPRLNSDYKKTATPIDLKVSFNNASAMYDKAGGHLESLLMGLLGAAGMDHDRHIVDAVRNHLFQKQGGPFTGLDLPAINIQRGRDHGVQPYNAYREMCGLKRAFSFSDLSDTMEDSAIKALNSVYAHVDDIDLFPGLMSERPLKGALVGPMLACIIAEQMQRLKRCDRFYYENNNFAVRFTPTQLAEIRKTTLSSIICANSEYAQRIQPNAFLMPDDLSNAPLKCSEMLDTDFNEWAIRDFCIVNKRVINMGKTKRITPCITCTCTSEGAQCHSLIVESCEALTKDYLFSEIQKDTVCAIQCAPMLRQRRGRL